MATYRVTLVDRQDGVFAADEGEPLLDAAQRAGVNVLHGCRAGACLTCAARLVTGRVQLPDGTALTPEMLTAHVVLPCVTTALSDLELALGPPGRTLLHPRHLRPWTE